LKAWLLTILKNVIRNHRRDQRRATAHLDQEASLSALPQHLVASGCTPEQALLDQSVTPQLQKALESLPKALRDAVWLRDVEGMTYAEMAKRLRIPAGTVMSRISRGRRLLRERLDDVSSRGPSSPGRPSS
jgi:RNA polymerase sigma-70 factor (ECF subfamily)